MMWRRHDTYHQVAGSYLVRFVPSARQCTGLGHYEASVTLTTTKDGEPVLLRLGNFGTAQEARTRCEAHAQTRRH